jgi:intraflagellar transport protein 46
MVDLETKIKPFIPDYIPTVGTIEDFLKPERPDNNKEVLGLTVIDEPCLDQTDP